MIIIILLFSLVSCQKSTVEKIYLVADEPNSIPNTDGNTDGNTNEPRPISTVANDPRGSSVIESTFIKYAEEFEALHPDSFEVSTPIYFQDIDEEGVLGVCITWTNDNFSLKEIQIDQESFFAGIDKDPIIPRTILFHELGHCELDLPHNPALTQFNGFLIPYSIMFPQLFANQSVYTQHDDHYMDVLFGGEGTLIPIDTQDSFSQPISIGTKNGYVGSAVYFKKGFKGEGYL